MSDHQETEPPQRPVWYTERQLKSKHPHVIVTGTFAVPDYFGGGAQEIDMAIPLRAYNKLYGRS